MNKLLTIEEAAELLGVDYKTVYRLVRSRKLPAGQIGRVYRISPADLEAYFESTKPARAHEPPAALRSLRCCVTGKHIVSELDIAGYDPDTNRPICREAWDRGQRRADITPQRPDHNHSKGDHA